MTIKPLSVVILASVVTLLAMHTGCVKTNPGTTTHDTTVITKTDTLNTTTTDTVVPVPPDITTGLVVYLKFNGNFADSSGLNNTVTAVGGASLGYDLHGYAQSAFTPNGSGQTLLVTNNGSYAVDTAFSVSFDFMINNYAYIIGDGNYDGFETFASIVNYANGNAPTFNVGFNQINTPQYFNFGINSELGTCETPNSTDPRAQPDTAYNFTPQLSTWYNAIAIFSHGTVSTYINGTLVSYKTGEPDSVLFCPDASLVIGGWWGGTENVNGGMDEFRFYNRTLTKPEIAYLARNFQLNSNKQNPGLLNGKASSIGGK
jgi:hypothetical protein